MKNMLANHDAGFKRSAAADMMRVVFVAGLILLVPLVAMQFTREVNWTAFDFIVAGVLLVGTGGLYVAISRHLAQPRKRALAKLALAAGFLLLWAELAVGIFGSPLAGS